MEYIGRQKHPGIVVQIFAPRNLKNHPIFIYFDRLKNSSKSVQSSSRSEYSIIFSGDCHG
jgi:hypothetical protein